jgi:tetratricopeptide (TPR) repeat protein
VSEETEGQDTGAEAVAGGVAGADPMAAALALAGASRDKADAFLDEQRALAANQSALVTDQRHHLHVQLRQLRLGIWEKRLGVLLRLATAMVGLAIASGLAFMVWDASRSSGLLIEPFSVPPDLAQRGLTGQVVAARLLDRLNQFQAETSSQRAPKSYAHSWDPGDIKIDIPETRVSLGELESFLREKLGHDIHVSGEIVRSEAGLSSTVRAGEEGAAITGQDTEIDALLQKLAESVYRITQPYRYGIYLGRNGQSDEAIAIFRQLALSGSDEERAWGYNGWQFQMGLVGGQIDILKNLQRTAVALNPNFVLGWENIANGEEQARPEVALGVERKILSLLSSDGRATIRPDAIPYVRLAQQAGIDRNLGAYNDAAREDGVVVQRQGGRLGGTGPSYAMVALDQAKAHDIGAARATLTEAIPGIGLSVPKIAREKALAELNIASQRGDWTRVRSLANAAALHVWGPLLAMAAHAYANARLGESAVAEKEIAVSPADCYPCLIARAHIAELQGQQFRADWWFERAVANAPSIPFAYCDWGEALLTRGKPDDAIAQFKLANAKGPHFADPLEMWGEALMAKNQSHLALAKFAEADKYAPNWGHLHLKWGEALGYAGRKGEARVQYQKASTLDLTAADKAELARDQARA